MKHQRGDSAGFNWPIMLNLNEVYENKKQQRKAVKVNTPDDGKVMRSI